MCKEDTMKQNDIGDKLFVEYYSKFITEEEKDKLDVWLENKKDQIDTELGEEILHERIPKLEPGEQNDVLT